MLRGVLIGDSLRPGAVLEGFPLTLTRIERAAAGQGQQPSLWTMMWFEVPDAYAEQLADALAGVLESQSGWYCDFQLRFGGDRRLRRTDLPLPPRRFRRPKHCRGVRPFCRRSRGTAGLVKVIL